MASSLLTTQAKYQTKDPSFPKNVLGLIHGILHVKKSFLENCYSIVCKLYTRVLQISMRIAEHVGGRML